MLTEEQKRMHRVCFTGHRPEKLKQSESVIVKALETAIKEAIADGKNVFISGMARGVDIWAAEIVLRLRKEGANVKLICASPYEGFERMATTIQCHSCRRRPCSFYLSGVQQSLLPDPQ